MSYSVKVPRSMPVTAVSGSINHPDHDLRGIKTLYIKAYKGGVWINFTGGVAAPRGENCVWLAQDEEMQWTLEDPDDHVITAIADTNPNSYVVIGYLEERGPRA